MQTIGPARTDRAHSAPTRQAAELMAESPGLPADVAERIAAAVGPSNRSRRRRRGRGYGRNGDPWYRREAERRQSGGPTGPPDDDTTALALSFAECIAIGATACAAAASGGGRRGLSDMPTASDYQRATQRRAARALVAGMFDRDDDNWREVRSAFERLAGMLADCDADQRRQLGAVIAAAFRFCILAAACPNRPPAPNVEPLEGQGEDPGVETHYAEFLTPDDARPPPRLPCSPLARIDTLTAPGAPQPCRAVRRRRLVPS